MENYSKIACHVVGDYQDADRPAEDKRRFLTADAMLWQNVLIEGRPHDPQQINNARRRAVEAFSDAGRNGFVDC